jgi:UDP-sugar transporter A1/2/3
LGLFDCHVDIFSFLSQLATISVVTNTVSILLQDRQQISEHGFFYGYNFVVWCVIAVSSLGGIIVAIVIRYTSNLAKSYAVSFTIFITSLISYVYLPENSNLSMQWLLAAVVVVISVLLYIDPASQVPKEVPQIEAPVVAEKAVELTSSEHEKGLLPRHHVMEVTEESQPILEEGDKKA